MSKFAVTIDGKKHEVELPLLLDNQLKSEPNTNQEYPLLHTVLVDGLPVTILLPEITGSTESVQYLVIDDRPIETTIDQNMKWIKSPWGVHSLDVRNQDPVMSPHHNGNGGNGKSGNGRIKAPIPGLIIQVRVSTGESVEAGQTLFILEAMKMENEIRAPRSGIIESISIAQGQSVAFNQILAEIE